MTAQPRRTRPGIGAAAAADPRTGAFRTLVAALAATAWLALWLWSASPYGRYLDHGSWGDAGALAAICRAVPAGGILIPALLYAGGWVLMIAAMMLPTTLPILEMFRRMTRDRPDGGRLLALVVAGYVATWFAFGLAAHAADWGVHALAGRLPWAGIERLGDRRGRRRRCGSVPVQRAQVSLPRQMPRAAGVHHGALARGARRRARRWRSASITACSASAAAGR